MSHPDDGGFMRATALGHANIGRGIINTIENGPTALRQLLRLREFREVRGSTWRPGVESRSEGAEHGFLGWPLVGVEQLDQTPRFRLSTLFFESTGGQ